MLAPIELLSLCMHFGMAIGASNDALVQLRLDAIEVPCSRLPDLEILSVQVVEIESSKAFVVATPEASASKIDDASCFEGCTYRSDFGVVADPTAAGLLWESIDGWKIEMTCIACLESIRPSLLKLHAVSSTERRAFEAVLANAEISSSPIDHSTWRNLVSAIPARSYNFDLRSHLRSDPNMNGQLMAIGIKPCSRSLVRKVVSNLPLIK
jgi:hypothetical protein